MNLNDRITNKFEELANGVKEIQVTKVEYIYEVNRREWQQWSTSVLNLFNMVFGLDSVQYKNFKKIYDEFNYTDYSLDSATGVFLLLKLIMKGVTYSPFRQ